ncbi:MAG: transposase [Sphingobacteriales bacterium]|nr:transposase [Sphingobacteriales bacterium]
MPYTEKSRTRQTTRLSAHRQATRSPQKEDHTAKAKRIAQVERNQRNIVEGKIGQTKNRYGLDRIAAKSNETTRVWVTCCIIATNIARWLKALSLCPFKIWYYILKTLQISI